jgi:hypothetical protein
MDESLAWLRDPEAAPALSELLCGLIRDIRVILMHPDLGNAAKLGAITDTVSQLAPPPGLVASAAPAAAAVAALLAKNTGPATALFEVLAGEQIRIELACRADRPLTSAECIELRARPGAFGHQRTGTLRTVNSGMAAAEVSSVIVPDRLPPSALRTLGIPGADDPAPPFTAIPLGKALAGFAVHREPLGARMVCDTAGISGARVSVESWARMWLDGQPVALASEKVTAEFCQQARARLACARESAVQERRAS